MEHLVANQEAAGSSPAYRSKKGSLKMNKSYNSFINISNNPQNIKINEQINKEIQTFRRELIKKFAQSQLDAAKTILN